VRVRDPLTVVIFGATGDLTQRKLIPALYMMHLQGFLPEGFAVVGFARREHSDATFRDLLADALRTFSRAKPDDRTLREFLARVFYHRGDIESPEAYAALRARLDGDATLSSNRLHYLSIKPDLFEGVLERIDAAGLAPEGPGVAWARVVIEKPFGRDLASAVELNATVRKHLDESQVYRIDHFLGKETVQNILSFRFANSIFEPLFNNYQVDHIQITAAETVGMESGRGAYYDATGAVRDMMQNHMLQLLCLVAMEPPANLTADAVRNEKVKVLQSIVPPAAEHVRYRVVRGQYAAGRVDGQAVKAYTEEDRVGSGSTTETYAALRLFIDNWRWAGVPIYLRTGKRMRKRLTEIVVDFKVPPLQLFQTVECSGDACDLAAAKPNRLIFRIQPDEGISLMFSAKRPGLQIQVENVAMDFSYSGTWAQSLPEAYERLLLDAMRGDSTLFTRSDEVEAAWRIVDPVMQSWAGEPDIPLHFYEPGSWGPSVADDLLRGHGDEWRKPS